MSSRRPSLCTGGSAAGVTVGRWEHKEVNLNQLGTSTSILFVAVQCLVLFDHRQVVNKGQWGTWVHK